MKTILLSLLTAALLGLATVATGYRFDAADFIAIAFATGLVAWTFAQYNATPRALRKARPIHLPIKTGDFPKVLIAGRRAA
jgi:hypothetical protein